MPRVDSLDFLLREIPHFVVLVDALLLPRHFFVWGQAVSVTSHFVVLGDALLLPRHFFVWGQAVSVVLKHYLHEFQFVLRVSGVNGIIIIRTLIHS